MTASTLNHEFIAMRVRFHRTLLVSVALHTVLILVLTMGRSDRPLSDAIIEVTWLDQVVPTPTAEIAPKPEPAPVAKDAAKPADHAAKPNPTVADLAATRPDIEKAVAALRPRTTVDSALDRQPAASPNLTRSALATMAPLASKGRPVALNRDDNAASRPSALTRGPAFHAGAVVMAADVHVSAGATSNALAGEEASRLVDGVLLTGPAANRPVVRSPLPEYPEWAKRQAMEAKVTLHFQVLPDGRIKENVQIRTGGFQAFDLNAVAALRDWCFAPLPGNEIREQWGTITFEYQLRD